MAIQLRAAANGTASTNSVTITLPTGWQPGDFITLVIRIGATGQTVTQTGGTGQWALQYNTSNATGGYTYAVAWRVMQPGDTAPVFGWTTVNAYTYSIIGLFSDAAQVLVPDVWAAELDTTVAANTVTPNAATASGSGRASVILTCARAATETAPASFTYTPSSGWTLPSGGDQWTGSANSRFSAVVYQLGLSGTVTPGAETLTDSTSGAYQFSVAHVLVAETPPLTAASGIIQARPGQTWLRRFHHRQIPQQAPAVTAGTTIATATLAAAGAVTAVVTQDAGTATTLTGAGSVTAVVTEIAPATLTGAGALGPVPVTQATIAAPAGAGAVNGLVTLPGGGTITGSGSVGTAVTQGVIASLAGAGSVTDVVTLICIAALTGAGAVNANAASSGSTAALAAGGHVSALAAQQAPAVLAAAGALSASGAITGTASLTGAGHVTAAAAQGATGSAAAAAALTALVTQPVTAGPGGAGAITAVGGSTAAFTVGVLTAADAPGSVLTASGAAGTLTAGTAATAALTAAGNPLAILTAADAPGAAVAGLLEETAAAVLDEAGGFILLEDGS